MLKKMPGLDKSKEESRSITTIQVRSSKVFNLKTLTTKIQGRGGKEKTPNSNGAQVSQETVYSVFVQIIGRH